MTKPKSKPTPKVAPPAQIIRVEVFRSANREWRFRAVARNGEIVAQSEGYWRRGAAEKTAGKVFPGIEIVRVTS